VIEVVKVVIVRQQHGVDPAQGIRSDGWVDRFSERVDRRAVFSAGRVERWVGEEAKAPDFKQGRRPAYVGGAKSQIRHAEIGVCRRDFDILRQYE
jgi:hypothetical protein